MIDSIRILFLDENKEKIWETDYIVNTLLPPNLTKIVTFSKDVDFIISEKYDILVFNCRKFSLNVILNIVKKINPKIIIQLSDEYKNENLNEYNILGKYCNLFLRQYNHKGYGYAENTFHIPLGYCNGAGINFMRKLPPPLNKIKKSRDRLYSWSWFGDLKHDRYNMLLKFSNIPSHSYSLESPVTKDYMIDKYLNSIFVPCGRGNSTLDCYRIYEAAMCGAIPCVCGPVNEIEETFKYEKNPPWIFGTTWDEVIGECKILLCDFDKLEELQNKILNWWKIRIYEITEKISNALNEDNIELNGIDEDFKIEHYWQNDEIFDENWFSYQNLYSKVVNQCQNDSRFVEVGCWKGRSTSYLAVEIANSKKNIDLYCVDTWEDPKIYNKFLDNMKPVEKNYFPLKLSSEDASKKFKDGSLDFVFLDASEDYENVKKDIQNWLPKIKPGGILAGHDYYPEEMHDWFPGVKQAVNETLKNFDTQELCYVYRVPYTDKEKFEGFPSVNFISIEETEDRRNLLYKKFKEYGITNITPHIYKKYDDNEHIIESDLLHRLSIGSRGPVTSHLKAIKEWYYNTDEPYTFMCEDDLGFDTVKYWNFTWKEFFDSLPDDWGCVQLCLLREEYYTYLVGFRNRCWCDWSGCAYLISRRHAKKLIDTYYKDDVFTLNYSGNDVGARSEQFRIPVIETIIYSNLTRVYMCPLFVEDVKNCPSSYIDSMGVRTGETNQYHHSSYYETLKWWREYACTKTPDELKCD
ncbi:MAG: class I SAM-dependent methyltransferase [Candidatus Fonsibacter ubiquis]